MTEEALFTLLLGVPESQRGAVLDRECAGNGDLRARVEALLAADGNPDRTVDLPLRHSESSGASVGTVGSMIAGKYKLIEAIGEGGMGSVWLAQQTAPVKRRVAVKLIKAGMDSKAVLARFEAERQALAMMDHPNIAKVLDGGLHDGRPFFVMELVKGLPITEYCDARKLTPKERLELFVPVCQAIQHAHQKGIIHRDIKPSNVLVALYDDRPVPKVIDFGLAKATGGSLTDLSMNTAFGGVVGTPQYMSPEQASLNNLDIDTRSDVYSLGILLYELLAGSPPFKRRELEKAGMLEILRVVREVEPPKPSTKLSSADALPSLSATRRTEPKKLIALLRGELDWIVLKAMEKDRTRRYDSANSFAADVQRYLGGEAVQAHPPSVGYRTRKFLRRYRRPVIAGGALAAALVAGVVGMSWGFVRASAERDKAVAAENEARRAEDEAHVQALAAARERDKANAEKDEKIRAQEKEQAALRAAREQVVRLHLRTGQAAMERDEGFVALHWYANAWKADGDNPERGPIHRLRIGTLLAQLPRLQAVRFHGQLLEGMWLSPDGTTAISHTNGKSRLFVWGVEDGRLTVPPLEHPAKILDAEFCHDGSHILTRAADDVLRVWNAKTGKMIGEPIRPAQQAPLLAGAVSPNGRTVLIAGQGQQSIQLVEVASGNTLKTWVVGEEPVSLRFSPKGDRFAAALARTAVLWDVAKEQPLAVVPHKAEPIVFEKSKTNPSQTRLPLFSPDGRRLVTLLPGANGFAVHDAITGQSVQKVVAAPAAFGLSISPSGRMVLVHPNGTNNLNCGVYSTETGKLLRTVWAGRYATTGAFAPDERSVFVRLVGSDVVRIDIQTGKRIGTPLRTHVAGPFPPQMGPDGRTLLIGERDGIARVFKYPAAGDFPAYDPRNGGNPDGYRITPDGSRSLIDVDKSLQLHDGSGKAAGKLLTEVPQPLAGPWLNADGTRAVLRHPQLGYRLWNTSSGEPVGDWFAAKASALNRCCGFTPDGGRVYTLDDSGNVVCRDAADGTILPDSKIQLPRDSGNPTTVVLSPDGSKFAMIRRFSSIQIYRTDAPREKPLYITNTHTGNISSAVFSPGGRYLATVSGDRTARVWDTIHCRMAAPVIRNYQPLIGVAFSPDERFLLTISQGVGETAGKDQVWDWKSGDLVAETILPAGSGHPWFASDSRQVAFFTRSTLSKVLAWSLEETKWDRGDLTTYLELLTGLKVDDTETPYEIGGNESSQRIKFYRAVWQKLHPELARPDPLDPESESLTVTPTAGEVPREFITPQEASKKIGETVTVKLTVRSVGQTKRYVFLNSDRSHKEDSNFVVVIHDPTPERLKALGLPAKAEPLVDYTILVRAKVELYQGKPQLAVREEDRIWILERDLLEKD